jgi:hypothetical protein
MDMVAHNTEIMDLEAMLLFDPLYGVEKERLHGVAMEDHLLPVCPGGDVVRGAGLEYSVPPHIRVYGDKGEKCFSGLGIF